ncbi:MAG: hypothetical protein ACR2PS_01745 [Pseudomonadales bacterium]
MLTGQLYQQLPHSGAMCLIDQVLSWDENGICCSADSHLSPANPLRENGSLPGLCALEYAAQALALHGVLNRPQKMSGARYAEAYVVTSQRLAFEAGDLSNTSESLIITAELTVRHKESAVYAVNVTIGDSCMLHGDLGVMLSELAG